MDKDMDMTCKQCRITFIVYFTCQIVLSILDLDFLYAKLQRLIDKYYLYYEIMIFTQILKKIYLF